MPAGFGNPILAVTLPLVPEWPNAFKSPVPWFRCSFRTIASSRATSTRGKSQELPVGQDQRLLVGLAHCPALISVTFARQIREFDKGSFGAYTAPDASCNPSSAE
jgi:hypothetical protein